MPYTTEKQDRVLQEEILGEINFGDMTWLIECIANNFDPEEVFPIEELEAWAEDNGYVKKDEL
jgi:hypothetical protein